MDGRRITGNSEETGDEVEVDAEYPGGCGTPAELPEFFGVGYGENADDSAFVGSGGEHGPGGIQREAGDGSFMCLYDVEGG